MDRLTSLTAFVRVVDNGGFSAAGRKLNMSTTMVSNHIQALEERLGARLLNRTTRKVSLTEIGKAYYDRATQILADIEQADDIAGAMQSTPRGTLRVYTATHIVQFIAPVVTEFLASHPEVKVDLGMGERAIDLIDAGFDVAIRLTPLPDSSLIVRSLATWRHVLCCSHGSKSMAGRSNCPISPSAIACATPVTPMTNGGSPTARARRPRCARRAI
jgi:DNA-binding transcriptional LysR family regulator